MSYYPVTLSLPGAGMIAVLGKRYETLSDAFIQEWMLELVNKYMVTPEYLLVSEAVRHDLRRIVANDPRMYDWVVRYAEDANGERAERYPNKITGKPLTIVVFPGLPEKTLMVASLLELYHEDVQVEGLSQISTRTYARLSERSL